jgi:predicted flap endonuclease-1-like 5' DNA nuclease
MKLIFLKNWENFPGHTIKTKQTADVSRRFALPLIENGTAKEYKEIDLPENCPGYNHLKDAGINTIEKTQAFGDLKKIKGIGIMTERRINQHINKLVNQ